MTLPAARGLGIHRYVNGLRLARLRDKGLRRAFVVVLAENRPALRTQIQSGFLRGERFFGSGPEGKAACSEARQFRPGRWRKAGR